MPSELCWFIRELWCWDKVRDKGKKRWPDSLYLTVRPDFEACGSPSFVIPCYMIAFVIWCLDLGLSSLISQVKIISSNKSESVRKYLWLSSLFVTLHFPKYARAEIDESWWRIYARKISHIYTLSLMWLKQVI